MDSTNFIDAADPKAVKHICNHLIKAFEQYLEAHAEDNDGAGVSFIDAFMAVHNFHKAIVFDLETRCQDVPEGLLRRIAVDTFTQYMRQ